MEMADLIGAKHMRAFVRVLKRGRPVRDKTDTKRQSFLVRFFKKELLPARRPTAVPRRVTSL